MPYTKMKKETEDSYYYVLIKSRSNYIKNMIELTQHPDCFKFGNFYFKKYKDLSSDIFIMPTFRQACNNIKKVYNELQEQSYSIQLSNFDFEQHVINTLKHRMKSKSLNEDLCLIGLADTFIWPLLCYDINKILGICDMTELKFQLSHSKPIRCWSQDKAISILEEFLQEIGYEIVNA